MWGIPTILSALLPFFVTEEVENYCFLRRHYYEVASKHEDQIKTISWLFYGTGYHDIYRGVWYCKS